MASTCTSYVDDNENKFFLFDLKGDENVDDSTAAFFKDKRSLIQNAEGSNIEWLFEIDASPHQTKNLRELEHSLAAQKKNFFNMNTNFTNFLYNSFKIFLKKHSKKEEFCNLYFGEKKWSLVEKKICLDFLKRIICLFLASSRNAEWIKNVLRIFLIHFFDKTIVNEQTVEYVLTSVLKPHKKGQYQGFELDLKTLKLYHTNNEGVETCVKSQFKILSNQCGDSILSIDSQFLYQINTNFYTNSLSNIFTALNLYRYLIGYRKKSKKNKNVFALCVNDWTKKNLEGVLMHFGNKDLKEC